MLKHCTLIAALLAASLAWTPASAWAQDDDRDDDEPPRSSEVRNGRLLSLNQIERMIVPRMRGQEYLGPEYNARYQVYRLKFITNGRVTFVDVDAVTGRIIGRR